MTPTNNHPMSAATEAVKTALLSVTQDAGCSVKTIELITQAIQTWEEVEKYDCSEYKQKIAALEAVLANTTIERNAHAASLAQMDEAFNELREEHLKTKQENGKLKASMRSVEHQLHLAVDATMSAGDILKSIEAQHKREIRIAYDKAANEFVVTFRTGQQLHFERPKQVAGNVENWLATLRTQVASSPE